MAGGVHGRRACIVGGVHGGGVCGGGHACPRQILRDTVNKQAVRILLECILVLDTFKAFKFGIFCHPNKRGTYWRCMKFPKVGKVF